MKQLVSDVCGGIVLAATSSATSAVAVINGYYTEYCNQDVAQRLAISASRRISGLHYIETSHGIYNLKVTRLNVLNAANPQQQQKPAMLLSHAIMKELPAYFMSAALILACTTSLSIPCLMGSMIAINIPALYKISLFVSTAPSYFMHWARGQSSTLGAVSQFTLQSLFTIGFAVPLFVANPTLLLYTATLLQVMPTEMRVMFGIDKVLNVALPFSIATAPIYKYFLHGSWSRYDLEKLDEQNPIISNINKQLKKLYLASCKKELGTSWEFSYKKLYQKEMDVVWACMQQAAGEDNVTKFARGCAAAKMIMDTSCGGYGRLIPFICRDTQEERMDRMILAVLVATNVVFPGQGDRNYELVRTIFAQYARGNDYALIRGVIANPEIAFNDRSLAIPQQAEHMFVVSCAKALLNVEILRQGYRGSAGKEADREEGEQAAFFDSIRNEQGFRQFVARNADRNNVLRTTLVAMKQQYSEMNSISRS